MSDDTTFIPSRRISSSTSERSSDSRSYGMLPKRGDKTANCRHAHVLPPQLPAIVCVSTAPQEPFFHSKTRPPPPFSLCPLIFFGGGAGRNRQNPCQIVSRGIIVPKAEPSPRGSLPGGLTSSCGYIVQILARSN